MGLLTYLLVRQVEVGDFPIYSYTLANDQLVDIGIPDSLTITSQFQDGL